MALNFPMRFNKAKALRSAEKSLSQGKVQAAIGEYRRIVEQEPNDWTALNMLGDLYVRVGQPDEANDLFARVAEHYRSQGFSLKAIAMYKKMLRLRPDDLASSSVLADLYAAQGLVVEARAQLLSIADAHTARHHTHAALETLRRIADLDPHNPEVRLRVAAAYRREGFAAEAAQSYAEAGDRFLERDAPEQALEAYTEALGLAPAHRQALAGVLAAHKRLRTPDEAAETIEAAASRDDADATLIELLLQAYVEADDAANAARVVDRLVISRDREDSALVRHLDVARLRLRAGDEEAATVAVGSALDAALSLRRDAELLELLDEITRRNPELLPALDLLARVYERQHDEAMLVGTFERIVEAALLLEDADAERAALRRLVELAPADTDARRARLRELGAADDASSDPAAVAAVAPSAATDEVPTFESFMLDAASPNTAAESTLVAPVFVEQDAAEYHAPLVSDPSASFADLDDFATAGSQSAAVEDGAENDAARDAPPPALDADADGRLAALLSHELESVDFYLAQGYTDVARDTLDMLERQYGAHEEIERRRARLAVDAEPTPASAPAADLVADDAPGFGDVSFGDQQFAEPVVETVYTSGHDATDPNAGFDLTAFELSTDVALETETTGAIFADEPDSGDLAPDDAPSATDFALSRSAVDESAEARAAAEQAESDDVFEGLQFGGVDPQRATGHISAAPDPAPQASAADFDPGLAAIFDEFRNAVEDEAPATIADYETHYNLGIAYQEMGLLDEAVEEFQKAAGVTAPGDGTPRYLQCCNMLGHCFMQKGLPPLAVMWFRRGLDAPDHTEDEYQAMRYELGTAYQAAGDHDRALASFMEVYGIDVSYRGVAAKLRELQTAVAS